MSARSGRASRPKPALASAAYSWSSFQGLGSCVRFVHQSTHTESTKHGKEGAACAKHVEGVGSVVGCQCVRNNMDYTSFTWLTVFQLLETRDWDLAEPAWPDSMLEQFYVSGSETTLSFWLGANPTHFLAHKQSYALSFSFAHIDLSCFPLVSLNIPQNE